jgi:hypothetical protein
MRKVINFFQNWVLAPNIWEKMYEFIGQVRYLKYFFVLRRNVEFCNIYKNERCFIIGNGPSINKTDLTKLKNEKTFVVNSFILHRKYKEIHPNYYCLIDPYIFKNSKGSKLFFADLEDKIHKDTTVFIPTFAKQYIDKKKLLRRSKIRYLLLSGLFKEDLRFGTDITKPIPNLINVILSSIIIAKYMGFKEIYLLGCDHNWLSLRNLKTIPRFFKNDYTPEADFNNNYENASLAVNELFKSYRLLKNKFNGTKIYNCTPGSYIDTFEYKKLNDVL